MFLKNERELGVKNGSLGSVESVSRARMAAVLDDGRRLAFDLKDYAYVDHGYAATIHKAQGMTVDRVQVLATPGIDSHSTYVALSRHRLAVELYYGRDDFANQSRLIRAASRERGKDMVSDYRAQRDTAISNLQGRSRALDPPMAAELNRAIQRFARVTKEIVDIRRAGGKEQPHELESYRKAGQALEALRPGGAIELREAFGKSYKLTNEAAEGRTAGAHAAMNQQQAAGAAKSNAAGREGGRLAAETEKRAELFVATWKQESNRAKHAATYAARTEARANLENLAKSLQRDPHLESFLQSRRVQLGLKAASTTTLSQDLQRDLGRGWAIGM